MKLKLKLHIGQGSNRCSRWIEMKATIPWMIAGPSKQSSLASNKPRYRACSIRKTVVVFGPIY